MNTFNTFGTNYPLRFALNCLFAKNRKNYQTKVIKLLEKRYGGKVILTYKCREAITLALSSQSLSRDSYVGICKFSCKEVSDSIKRANLNVEFLDLEKGGVNFSAVNLKKALTKNSKIKAVLVQNTLGYPCDIENIAKICRQKKLVLIEDLAHCVGGYYKNGKEVGSFGDFVALSFGQNKIIDATAGGALIYRKSPQIYPPNETPNFRRQIADRIYPINSYIIRNFYPLYLLFQKLISFGKPFTKVESKAHKLPSWYCSLIFYRFNNLESELAHRRKIAKIYARLIRKDILSLKLIKQTDLSAHFRFPIFLEKKNELIKYLAKKRIFLDDPWYKVGGLTLPTHINISSKKAEEISMLINKWLDRF